jgi:hypothetical protein
MNTTLDIQVHGGPLGQGQTMTYYEISVPANVPADVLRREIGDFFYHRRYWGGHIEHFLKTENGRTYYKAAAYKD